LGHYLWRNRWRHYLAAKIPGKAFIMANAEAHQLEVEHGEGDDIVTGEDALGQAQVWFPQRRTPRPYSRKKQSKDFTTK
jgi:hypothetical protein